MKIKAKQLLQKIITTICLKSKVLRKTKRIHMLPKKNKNKGSLEVICGPMFSGKSEELIRRLRRAKIAKQNVLVFKHALDNRTTIEHIASHNGNKIDACPTDNSLEIKKGGLTKIIDVIGIDEVQFFDNAIIQIICELVDVGKRVVVAGLDCDFRGIPFGPISILLAIADTITKLQAICTECGKDAHLTQRLVNGKPAKFNDPIVQIGAEESYQARCRTCYIIDKKPTWNYEKIQNNI